MDKQLEINKDKLRELSNSDPFKIIQGFELPARGSMVPLAQEVLDDLEKTSGVAVHPSETEGEVIGHFGMGFDPTSLLVAIITWILKEVRDHITMRRRAEKRKCEHPSKPLSESELREIRQLVLDFGSRFEDRELLAPQVAVKIADSVQRVLIQHPEVLLQQSGRDSD